MIIKRYFTLDNAFPSNINSFLYARSGVNRIFNGIASTRTNFVDMAMLWLYKCLYMNDTFIVWLWLRSNYATGMFLRQQPHYWMYVLKQSGKQECTYIPVHGYLFKTLSIHWFTVYTCILNIGQGPDIV